MSSSHVDEIRKEDKKAFKVFAIIIVVALISGGILGFISEDLKEVLGGSISSFLINAFKLITPFASIVLSILMIVISEIVYNNSKKQYNLCRESNDDDSEIDKIEDNLSIIIVLTSVNNIIGFFFFGISFMMMSSNNIDGELDIVKVICAFIGFILCITSTIVIQKNIINFEKEINPLLKGSIYDIKFAEKWVDSCDEAIQLGVFKSAYKSYRTVSTACPILWVLCSIGYDLLDFGIAPMVIVIIIWLIQTISYSIESIKYNKVR